MFTVTPRMLPLILLAAWLAGVGLLFAAAIHGDFDLLVDAARKGEIRRELDRLATGAALRVRNTVWGEIDTENAQADQTSPRQADDVPDQDQSGEEKAGTEPGALTQARYTPTEDSLSIQLTFARNAPKYTFFTLQDPALLVLDFQDVDRHEVKREQNFSTGPITRTVFGRHSDYLRLVLYPRKNTGDKDIRPDIATNNQRIQITVPSDP
ncbi:MAG: AMIN domain-containing protein [Desulfovermiculus sp.]